jgi:hypothetical protein
MIGTVRMKDDNLLFVLDDVEPVQTFQLLPLPGESKEAAKSADAILLAKELEGKAVQVTGLWRPKDPKQPDSLPWLLLLGVEPAKVADSDGLAETVSGLGRKEAASRP